MNTPTIEEINAVLDPLIERISAKWPGHLTTLDRRCDCTGARYWTAYTGGLISNPSESGPTPQEAVEKLLARDDMRRETLQSEIARLQSELARLETP